MKEIRDFFKSHMTSFGHKEGKDVDDDNELSVNDVENYRYNLKIGTFSNDDSNKQVVESTVPVELNFYKKTRREQELDDLFAALEKAKNIMLATCKHGAAPSPLRLVRCIEFEANKLQHNDSIIKVTMKYELKISFGFDSQGA